MKIRNVAITASFLLLSSVAAFFVYQSYENRLLQADVAAFSKIAPAATDPSACAVLHDAEFRAHCQDNVLSNLAYDSKNPVACREITDTAFRSACEKAASAALGSGLSSEKGCDGLSDNAKNVCVDSFRMNAGFAKPGFECSSLSTETMKNRCAKLLPPKK